MVPSLSSAGLTQLIVSEQVRTSQNKSEVSMSYAMIVFFC